MRRLLALTISLLLAACGGGSKSGGGGSASVATLSGFYWAVAITATTVTTDSETTWGSMIADGAGSIMPNTTSNDDGVVSMPLIFNSFDYEVDPNGEIRFLLGPTPVYRGRISDDGRYAVLSSLTAPRIIVISRREGTHSAASVVGSYQFAGAGFRTGPAAYFMSAAFDGVGMYSGQGTVNEAGSFDGGIILGTYAVTSGGGVDASVLGLAFEGGITGDGNLMLLGGGTGGGTNPQAWFLTRRPDAGGTNSLFSGSYYACGVETVLGTTDEAQGFWSVVRADGSGTFTMQGQTTGAGGVAPLSLSGTYSVAGNGVLTMDRAGLGENLSGAVSPDGRIAIASGGTTANSNPVMIVMFRR